MEALNAGGFTPLKAGLKLTYEVGKNKDLILNNFRTNSQII